MSNKQKEVDGSKYTAIGVRKAEYKLISNLSKVLELPKSKVLSDLIKNLPPDFVQRYIDRQLKKAYIRKTKEQKRLKDKIVKMYNIKQKHSNEEKDEF